VSVINVQTLVAPVGSVFRNAEYLTVTNTYLRLLLWQIVV